MWFETQNCPTCFELAEARSQHETGKEFVELLPCWDGGCPFRGGLASELYADGFAEWVATLNLLMSEWTFRLGSGERWRKVLKLSTDEEMTLYQCYGVLNKETAKRRKRDLER